jgi:hypothetical protein
MTMRSYLLYLRIKTKLLLKDKVNYLGTQMDGMNKSAMIKNMVYKQELEQWYIERKRKYQEELFFEGQSKEQMQVCMYLYMYFYSYTYIRVYIYMYICIHHTPILTFF